MVEILFVLLSYFGSWRGGAGLGSFIQGSDPINTGLGIIPPRKLEQNLICMVYK